MTADAYAATVERPDDTAVAAVLRELAAVVTLRTNHPRYRAAMASKRAMVAELEAYDASRDQVVTP